MPPTGVKQPLASPACATPAVPTVNASASKLRLAPLQKFMCSPLPLVGLLDSIADCETVAAAEVARQQLGYRDVPRRHVRLVAHHGDDARVFVERVEQRTVDLDCRKPG